MSKLKPPFAVDITKLTEKEYFKLYETLSKQYMPCESASLWNKQHYLFMGVDSELDILHWRTEDSYRVTEYSPSVTTYTYEEVMSALGGDSNTERKVVSICGWDYYEDELEKLVTGLTPVREDSCDTY